MVSILHYVYHLPNNRATTSWRKLNTNLVYSWAPKPGYRLFLVPVCTRVKYHQITLLLYAKMPVLRPGMILLTFSNNALISCSFDSHPIALWLYFSFHLAFIDLRVARIWRAHGAHLTRAWLAHGSHLAHIWRTSGAHLTCIGSHSART